MKTKIVVVTGANKGIGLEIVRQLTKQGHTVVLTARDEQKGLAVAHDMSSENHKVHFVKMDVTNEDDINNLKEYVDEHFQKLDVLINNAGILVGTENSLKVSRQSVQMHLDTNFIGPLLVSQKLIPLLKKSDDGRIINFSTSMARLSAPGPGTAAYRFSKVAVNGLTAMMAADLMDTNIKVNSMDPGWVKTDMGGAGASRTVAEGADTAVWLATAEKIPTGKFFRDRKELLW